MKRQSSVSQVDYLRIITWVIIIMVGGRGRDISIGNINPARCRSTRHRPPSWHFSSGGICRSHRFLLYWARWSEQTPIARAFAAINQSLRWLGKPQPPAATPAERAEKLRELLPEAGEEIDTSNKRAPDLRSTVLGTGICLLPGKPARPFDIKTIKRLINRFFS